MDQQQILQATESYVKETLSGEGTGHDWFHIERVRKLAFYIAKQENADLYLVELGALLHDIADWKFHGGDPSAGIKKTQSWLKSQQVDEQTISQVCHIVENISFKGGTNQAPMKTAEGKIVQDADRLDALGAIGISRCFAYGGHKGREIYNPEIPPKTHQTFEDYKEYVGTSLNHFDEKLLLLKDLMNTPTGKRLAEERHHYVKEFKERFLREWAGEI